MVIILKKLKMEFEKLKIDGLVLCKPKIIEDDRGFFAETFRKDLLEDFISQKLDFCQHNTSKSSFGVLRGLHFQNKLNAQAKLIRVISGNIIDIIVDIRTNSSTFKEWASIKINKKNRKQIWIPEGFAHGFITTSKNAEVNYKANNYWNKEGERTILWNDKDLNIDWNLNNLKLERPILSDKDLIAKSLAYLENKSELF